MFVALSSRFRNFAVNVRTSFCRYVLLRLPPFWVSPPRGWSQYTFRTDLPWFWCCLLSMVHIFNINTAGGLVESFVVVARDWTLIWIAQVLRSDLKTHRFLGPACGGVTYPPAFLIPG